VDVDQQIETLAAAEISRLLIRHRRGETLERYQPRIDTFLSEVLARTDEFVPSEAGVILLDDPKAKIFDLPGNTLTVIAAFGERPRDLLGERLSCSDGLAGQVYSSGRARSWSADADAGAHGELQDKGGIEINSLLGVPVVLGNAICGVILLINRRGDTSFSDENGKLLEIFAAYISSSIQNTLDGMRAKELAQKDDLTGLYNDRYLNFRLRSEIQRAAREGTGISLLFLDLDRFKTINDRFGHLEGSRTLHLIGILLINEIPTDAIAARYGGDEFVVILPDTDAGRAMVVAQDLREKIAATRFIEEQDQVEITASVGVSSMEALRDGPGGRDRCARLVDILIRQADEAMYQAKSQGRNRVVVATPYGEE
jgi:diguanylate cyclase (GGDEF)-like protein